ncbi:MAG: type II toxin-antitoxin system PemK/MazF family toxin [Anaerolineaceae bacterium]|jgi:mRNA interferase MazF|nr:type II toxin-antitoxin system PemK/MazF family toxin [Anaerolineaceae bacterium]
MGKFVKGDVVVVPFPFSDLSHSKRRPALVISPLNGDDVILCQITTPAKSDGYSISLTPTDFQSGKLDHDSNIRPNRLFTADSRIVAYCAGKLTSEKTDEVINKLVEIIQS